MKINQFPLNTACDAGEICFGLDRTTDEASLAAFVKRFSSNDLLETLIPRLSDPDIMSVLDFLTHFMKKHLSEEEYHELFMGGTSS